MAAAFILTTHNSLSEGLGKHGDLLNSSLDHKNECSRNLSVEDVHHISLYSVK